MDPERWKRIDALLSGALMRGGQRASSHPAEKIATLTDVANANKTQVEQRLPSEDEAGVSIRGSALGRYIVLNKLGGGGMGVVYAAYDPELDRRVALKLLRSDPAEGSKQEGARERLLREAQAMARLSHPNVISVHDVGTLGEQVFIAMELIDGRTLTRWLKEENRAPRRVLEVLIQAGKGLAAAHAGGLVHRDFKPDNVFVAKDGHVKVLDFGLARAAEDLASHAPTIPPRLEAFGSSTPRVLEARLTRTGAFSGTPAYMAPEQFLGKTTDARTDQFSFCVALYEALYGERPFSGDSVEALAQQVTSGKVKDPQKSRRVPGYLRPILRRGLRTNPDDRFPSMELLLRELGKDPRVLRRRALAVGGVALALAAVGTGYQQAAYRHSQLCKGAEQKLLGIWDEERSRAAEAAFLATGASSAAEAFRETKKGLDRYARSWVNVQTDACEATRLRGEQSEQLLDLRMECLSQRREELKALVDLFAAADAKLVQSSVQATQSLTALDGCSDSEALRAPIRPPADPGTRTKVEELQKDIGKVTALHHAGRYSVGLPLATKIVDQAKAIHYRSAEAQALYVLGSFQIARGDYKSAEHSIKEAVLAAEAGRDDAVLGRAWTTLVWIAEAQDHYELSHESANHAFAVIERLGGNDKLLARLFNALGNLFQKESKYEEALVHFRKALALKEKLVGPEDQDIAVSLTNIGIVLQYLDQVDQAVDHFQRALAIREKALGPTHPEVADSLQNLARMLDRRGKHAEARPLLERALTIQETALGPLHRRVAATLDALGTNDRYLGKYDRALAAHQRALTIREKTLGPGHSSVAVALNDIGALFSLQGRHVQALDYYRRALAIREKALGPEHPSLSSDLTGIGKEYLDLHLARKAIAPLERSLSLGEKMPGGRVFLANTRFALARALKDAGRDLERALQLASLAHDTYAADGDQSRGQLAEVNAWLQASRKGSKGSWW